MFAQNGEKGLIPGESRIRRFQNIEKFGSDLIQDQCMYGELCPIKCSCSEFPNGKPKRSRRLDDAGVNHLSEQVKNDRIARDLQLIDRDKELRVLVFTGVCSKALENWNEDVEVVHVGSKQRIHGRGGTPSQLALRTRLPRYRRPRDLSRDIVRSSWTSRKWRQCVTVGFWGAWSGITLGCGLSVNAGTVWKCAGGYWSRGSSEACKRGNNAANDSHSISILPSIF